MLLYAVKAYLKQSVDSMKKENTPIDWTGIEIRVANDFHVRRQHVTDLRKGFMEDGDVYGFGQESRGKASVNSKKIYNKKITNTIMKVVATMV